MKQEIIENILNNFETPIYVFDIDKLKQRIKFLRENLTKRLELCYAIKANTFIIKEINDDVDRFEVCSPGEYSICEEANITPEKIVISGVYKTPSVIDYMITSNSKIGRYTVESLEQLNLLDELSKKHNIKLNVLLRLTSGNQFGINEEDIEDIISKKDSYTNLYFEGIQYFSGTQKRTNKRLQKEIDYIDEFLLRLQEKYNYVADELEFGTGFPVHYFQGEEFNEQEFLKEFSNGIDNMKYKGKIVIELGRSIAAPARNDENTEDWNLMGSLCTINDIIIKQYPVSNLQIGDAFIFKNTGAYCMTEGISLFLSRELPQVALLKNDNLNLVRDAFKTYTLNKANYNK